MENILSNNLNIITNSTIWFCDNFGIGTPEFTEAVIGLTFDNLRKFYEAKGIEFNLETTPIEEEAMLSVYDRVMELANLAQAAMLLGMKPSDFNL